MAKKNYDIKGNDGFDDGFDSLYSDELDSLAKINQEEQLESYKSIDITEKESLIRADVAKFITGIVKLYHKVEKRVDDFYISESEKTESESELDHVIESVAKLESLNLVSLLKQVKWADHLVDTLMRRLEAGGNMDMDLIDAIMKAQQSSMNITLTISSYIRNIPTYIKHLKADLTENGENNFDMPLMIGNNNGVLELSENVDSEVIDSDFAITQPQRGMKDMLKRIREAKKMESEKNDTIDFEEISE